MSPNLKSRLADAVTAIRSGLHVSNSVMKKLLQDVHDTAADPKADRDALEYVFGSISSMAWRDIVDKKMTPPWPLEHHARAMGLFMDKAGDNMEAGAGHVQGSEWVPVRRSDLIDWAQDWQVDHGTGDGDIVTPFDSYLLRTPKVETTPVPLDAPPPKFSPAPAEAQPAPSAPVGVEAMPGLRRELAKIVRCDEGEPVWIEPNEASAILRALAPQPAAVDGADAKDAEIERLRAEVEAVWAAMPRDARYLDPPDGGCVPLHEQVRRMAADAALAQPAPDGGFTAADMMDARQEGRKEAAADAGFTAADMMDARQEGRKEAQQLAAVDGACGDACLHIAIERDQLKARAERQGGEA